MGQIEATARDLSERFTVYFERLPKQMRWNAELVVIEVMQEFGYPVIRDIDSINASARGVRSFLDDTPNLIRSEREAVLSSFQTELGAALGSVEPSACRDVEYATGGAKSHLGNPGYRARCRPGRRPARAHQALASSRGSPQKQSKNPPGMRSGLLST